MKSRYYIRQAFYNLVTIMAVLLLCFFLKSLSPEDPVDKHLSLLGVDASSNPEYYQSQYNQIFEDMNLHLPPFYMSWTANQPPNIGRSLNKNDRFSPIFPSFQFNGANNQFHIWITGLLKGNFGSSIIDGQRVTTRFQQALIWTLLILIPNILIAIPLSIVFGILLVKFRGHFIVQLIESLFVFLLSMPLFWLATLCLVYLCNSYYGLGIFSGVGLWESGSQFQTAHLKNLILPILIISLLDIAYLSQILSTSMAEEQKKPYIQSLISRGIDKKRIFNFHLLKNSLIPMISIITENIPKAIGGTLIIEVIFNIPGVGRLMLDSVLAQDLNMIVIITITIAILTLISYQLGDIINQKLNPKSILS